MIKLVTSFSKKRPIPGEEYSSQSFHAGIELELSDSLKPEEIQAQIHDVSELLKASVDAELNGGKKPTAETPPAVAQATRAAPAGNGPALKITNKQAKFITDLASQQGFKLSELNAHIKKLYGATSVYDLSRKEASALLDSLQQKKAA